MSVSVRVPDGSVNVLIDAGVGELYRGESGGVQRELPARRPSTEEADIWESPTKRSQEADR